MCVAFSISAKAGHPEMFVAAMALARPILGT